MGFTVPEDRRVAPGELMSVSGDMGTTGAAGNNGVFLLDAVVPGRPLLVIASDGLGWEHVSVTLHNDRRRNRCPTWAEMCHVKSVFWGPEDVVVQFHPRESEYVNNHAGCLHLWRQVGVEFATPAKLLVGVKDLVIDTARGS